MSPYPINSDVPARITRNYEKKELDTISSAAGVVKAGEFELFIIISVFMI